MDRKLIEKFDVNVVFEVCKIVKESLPQFKYFIFLLLYSYFTAYSIFLFFLKKQRLSGHLPSLKAYLCPSKCIWLLRVLRSLNEVEEEVLLFFHF